MANLRIVYMQRPEQLTDKDLAVFPIPTGNELNIFSTQNIREIKIMDMKGGVVCSFLLAGARQNVIDIKGLPCSTYIVEALFENDKTGRSVFVKM